jgi:cell division protein ZapA (FtsZ GTPase activity inhibitor)
VTEKRTVSVRIRGQDFRIRSDESPEQLARIAQTVDETMERVETRTGAVDSYDVAMLTALNLAREIVAFQTKPRPVDSGRLRALIEMTEAATASEAS